MVRNYFIILIFFLISFPARSVESVNAKHVRVSWLAPKVFNANSSEVIGLYFEIDPEWHLYWKNSGDSGAAPKFNFQNGNYEVGSVQWPNPKRISVAHLVNFGYEKDVAFLFPVSVKGLGDDLKLSVKIEWLVCKVECIPGFADLTLTRPVRDQLSEWDSAKKSTLSKFQQQVPLKPESSPWQVKLIEKTEDQLIVLLTSKSGVISAAPEIFPIEGEFVNPQKPKTEPVDLGYRYTFSLPPGRLVNQSVNVLIVSENQSWEQSVEGLGPSPSVVSKESGPLQKMGLMGLMFFAFLGGIILNLMPCVLPVLSIKFLSILKSSAESRRREAVLYLAGVLVTFFSLGVVFLILRSAGSAIGWGFQLQSPFIVLLLIVLFWLMSLNFLGFFEFGESITNVSGRFNRAGSFSTGVLAVFVAAPCTGPFMGTALGAAAVLPASSALVIFLSLGFGLGFPFFLVSFVPSLYKKMPKPGAWMEKLKQFLAFPLLGTVIWLMWVLGIQLGSDGWLLAVTLLLFIGLSIWLGKTFSKMWMFAGHALAIIAIVLSLILVKKMQTIQASADKTITKSSTTWLPYDRSLIDQARSKKQSVFVDFTAAWCITCQVNKKTVLDTEGVQNLFKQNNVVILRADWTNQDPVITQALAEFDRNSVPVYLFYDKGADAVILPQILTISMIEDLFNKKE